jgi:hypothetical protein
MTLTLACSFNQIGGVVSLFYWKLLEKRAGKFTNGSFALKGYEMEKNGARID